MSFNEKCEPVFLPTGEYSNSSDRPDIDTSFLYAGNQCLCYFPNRARPPHAVTIQSINWMASSQSGVTVNAGQGYLDAWWFAPLKGAS